MEATWGRVFRNFKVSYIILMNTVETLWNCFACERVQLDCLYLSDT